MKGKVRPKGECCCGGKWELKPIGLEVDFFCPNGHRPRRYYLDLSWKGQRIRLFSDRKGKVFASYKHANRILESIRNEIDGPSTFDPTMYVKKDQRAYLIENYCQSWFKSMTETGLKPKTVNQKKWAVRHIADHFRGQDIRDLRKRNYREFIESTPKNTSRTVFRDQLQALLTWAYHNDDIEKPIKLDLIKSERQVPVWLDPEQQEEILQHISESNRPIYRFIIQYGCRPGEARALQWDCVDFRHKNITIKRTFSLRKLVEEPKEGGWKVLPLVPEIEDMLKDLRDKRPDLSNPFVFTHHGYIYADSLRENWKRATEKAGYPGVKLYHNRHSFALQRLEAGFSYEEVGAVLGHRNKSTTQRHYARLQAKKLANVVEMRRKPIINQEIQETDRS